MKRFTIKKSNGGVFYAEGIPLVNKRDIQAIKSEAEKADMKRARLCCHGEEDERIHEMLIVLNNQTYIRPHLHIGKSESLHVIEGSADLILFDANGRVYDSIPLGTYSSGRVFYYRIDRLIFHTQIVRSENFIFHEVTNGPFNKSDTLYASWAPDGLYKEESEKYITNLSQRIKNLTHKK